MLALLRADYGFYWIGMRVVNGTFSWIDGTPANYIPEEIAFAQNGCVGVSRWLAIGRLGVDMGAHGHRLVRGVKHQKW